MRHAPQCVNGYASDPGFFEPPCIIAVQSRQFHLADVAGSGRTVVVAERVVEVRDGHDPNTRIVYWRLYEAPEMTVNRHETVGRTPNEQARAGQ